MIPLHSFLSLRIRRHTNSADLHQFLDFLQLEELFPNKQLCSELCDPSRNIIFAVLRQERRDINFKNGMWRSNIFALAGKFGRTFQDSFSDSNWDKKWHAFEKECYIHASNGSLSLRVENFRYSNFKFCIVLPRIEILFTLPNWKAHIIKLSFFVVNQ